MNVKASTDVRSAHCKSSITIATAPVAASSPTISSSRAPIANDEAGEPVPVAAGTGWETSPAALSSCSTSPNSRSVSVWSARAESTLRPVARARHRRARAVFPTPGTPSMATSQGSPASTRVTTSATRSSSAARPTKRSSGACRSCTRTSLLHDLGNPDITSVAAGESASQPPVPDAQASRVAPAVADHHQPGLVAYPRPWPRRSGGGTRGRWPGRRRWLRRRRC